MIDYFPLDVAFDKAFFNRTSEKERLRRNLSTNTHTLITSPRRYGKTSLVLKVIAEQNIVGTQIDMMLASNPDKIMITILDGIANASTAMASGKNKIIELIKKIFQPFNTIESMEFGKLRLKFHPYTIKSPDLIILDALKRLEALAKQLDKRVVLFLMNIKMY